MKSRIILATVLAIVATACSGREPDRPAAAAAAPVFAGHWMRHGELGGDELFLSVTQGWMTFAVETDTMYHYQYQRRGDVLEVRDDGGRPVSPARVLKLTADSLVLDFPLPGITRPMRFWRDRGEAGDTLRIGSKLYDRDGKLWGTVVEIALLHRFPNGMTEGGVLVERAPRAGNARVPPQWVSRREAERFTRR